MSTLGSPRLVFGDDGSPGADVAWLWINEHRWLGWRLEVVTATGVALGEPHSWTEPVPCRRPFAEAGFDSHLSRRPEQDPRLALCADGELLVVGGRGRGLPEGASSRQHHGMAGRSSADADDHRPPRPADPVGRPRHRRLGGRSCCDRSARHAATCRFVEADGRRRGRRNHRRGRPGDRRSGRGIPGRDATVVPTVLRGSEPDGCPTSSRRRTPTSSRAAPRGRCNREPGRLGTTARRLVHNRDVSVLLTHRRIEQHVDVRAAAMGARRH